MLTGSTLPGLFDTEDKGIIFFEMSAAGCQLTQRNIPEDLHLKQHHRENCKCHKSWVGKAVP